MVVILALILIISASLSFIYFKKHNKAVTPVPAERAASTDAVAAPANIEFKEVDMPPVEAVASVSDPASEALFAATRSMAKGDLAAAEATLRAAIAETPSEKLNAALAEALSRRALRDLSGDPAMSKAVMLEAVSLSRRPEYQQNLAGIQLKLNDLEGAASSLESIKGEPDVKGRLKSIYTRLGQKRYSDGDVAGAAEYLAKALDLDPGDRRISESLREIRRETRLEQKMGSKEGSHFTVRFDGGENAVAGYLIGLHLEEAYIKVGGDLGLYPDDRIEALLYSRERFRDITRSPAWAGALFDGRIKIPAGGVTEKTRELEAVIFHEYTHAVVHRLSKGRAPVWLNEGLAQYEEGKDTREYGLVLKELAATGRLTLRSFEGSFKGMGTEEAQIAYLVSLSATEYIIREFGAFSARKILEGLGQGMELESAVKNALYLSYDELERSWLNSLQRR